MTINVKASITKKELGRLYRTHFGIKSKIPEGYWTARQTWTYLVISRQRLSMIRDRFVLNIVGKKTFVFEINSVKVYKEKRNEQRNKESK